MSQPLMISAPAKLNLYLKINGKLANGYHYLESFIIFINLFDHITINNSYTSMLHINGTFGNSLKKVMNKDNNLISQVISYIKDKYNIKKNIETSLTKNIPISAGLAGGSADAAAILKGLNIIWDLNLNENELSKIAIKFGADIPSCIYSKSGLIRGVGEQYTYIPLKFKLPILLVSNLPMLNTKSVYDNLQHQKTHHTPFALIKDFSKNEFLNFIKHQTNNLTAPAIKLLPHINEVLSNLNETNPIFARMTGSGSSCFAIYQNKFYMYKAFKKMQKLYPNYLIRTVTNII